MYDSEMNHSALLLIIIIILMLLLVFSHLVQKHWIQIILIV